MRETIVRCTHAYWSIKQRQIEKWLTSHDVYLDIEWRHFFAVFDAEDSLIPEIK